MAVTILIPTALRSFTDRKAELSVEAGTVGEAAAALAAAYPDILTHLYQDGGTELRSFINVFVGETNIRNLQGLDTPVSPGDTIMLVPAIAGGRGGLDGTRTGERVFAGFCGTPCPPVNFAAGEKLTGDRR